VRFISDEVPSALSDLGEQLFEKHKQKTGSGSDGAEQWFLATWLLVGRVWSDALDTALRETHSSFSFSEILEAFRALGADRFADSWLQLGDAARSGKRKGARVLTADSQRAINEALKAGLSLPEATKQFARFELDGPPASIDRIIGGRREGTQLGAAFESFEDLCFDRVAIAALVACWQRAVGV